MNKNKSFDFVIRKKLNEMPPTPSYGAWQTFQEKWVNKEPNTTPISDQNFDKKGFNQTFVMKKFLNKK